MEKSKFLIGEVNRKLPPPEKKQEPAPAVYSPEGQPVKFPGGSIPVKSLKNRTYRVLINYPEKNKSIRYDMKALGKGASGSVTEIEFTKENLYINGKTPDKVLYELDIEFMKALYPVSLHIDYNTGRARITNTKEIEKRLSSILPRLEREYTGKLFNNYNKRIKALLESPFQCSRTLLAQDSVFPLYSLGIYDAGKTGITKDLTLYTGSRMTLAFKGECRVEQDYNHLEGIFLYYQGHSEHKEQKYEIKVEYNLCRQDFTIKDIVGEVFREEENKPVSVIQINMYQLREKEPESPPQKTEVEREFTEKQNEEYFRYLKNKNKNFIERLLGL